MSIQTDTHHFFWSGPFSNFDLAPIKHPYLDFTVPTSEHAFMFAKASFFKDDEAMATILAVDHPRDAKHAGRGIKGYNELHWAAIREGAMTFACLLKYQQNEEHRKALLDTGDRILVEASPYDGVWGIKLSVEDAAAGKPWNGLNLLGLSLMKVREMVKA
jgi:ribA/ribD-fused uncharacterized protein